MLRLRDREIGTLLNASAVPLLFCFNSHPGETDET